MEDTRAFVENGEFVDAGVMIIKAKPFVYTVLSDIRTTTCDYCLQNTSLSLRCIACKYVYYCSKECQLKAWKSMHKWECSILKKVPSRSLMIMTIMTLRMILKLQHGGDKQKEYYTKTQYRTFNDLTDACENNIQNNLGQNSFSTVYRELQCLFDPDKLPPYREILNIYNVFFDKIVMIRPTILENKNRVIGCGFYMATLYLDHSCENNAHLYYDRQYLILRTVKPIENYHDLDVSIKQFDVFNYNETKEIECKRLNIDPCVCEKCLDETDKYCLQIIPCPNTNCKEICNVNEESCTKCKTVISKQYIDEIDNTYNEITYISNKSGYQNYRRCKVIYKRAVELLSPSNITSKLSLKLLCILIQNYMDSLPVAEEMLDYLVQHIPDAISFYGLQDQYMCNLYFSMAKLTLKLKKRDNALEYLDKTKELCDFMYKDNKQVEEQIDSLQNKILETMRDDNTPSVSNVKS